MFALRLVLLFILSIFRITLAAPAPAPEPDATATPTATATADLIPIGPIRTPFPLDYTVLSFSYYKDFNCQTLMGSVNVSSFDMAGNKCFTLDGNSLVFTYQEHDGALSLYNPNEVNMRHYDTKDCYIPPAGTAGGPWDGYMGGLGGCFGTTDIGSFQAAWGEG